MTAPSLRIRCAICGKLVDRWTVSYSPIDQSRTLTVWCHGASDAMVLYDHQLASITPAEIHEFEKIDRGEIEGIAFANPQLESAR